MIDLFYFIKLNISKFLSAMFEKIMDHLRQFYALTANNSVIRKVR